MNKRRCNFKKLDIIRGSATAFEDPPRKYEMCTLKQLNGLCDGEKNCVLYQIYKKVK